MSTYFGDTRDWNSTFLLWNKYLSDGFTLKLRDRVDKFVEYRKREGETVNFTTFVTYKKDHSV